jgi:hypothetical protein
MLKKYLAVLCFGVMSCSAANAVNPDKEFADFFAQYEKLSNAYDLTVLDLYADNAKIIFNGKSTDGIEHRMSMTGKQLKTMLLENWENLRSMNDRSTFSQVEINRNGDSARITASRYSYLKCTIDNKYYMIVSRDRDKKLYISEEFAEVQANSICKDGINSNVALQLPIMVNIINKNLPMQIDPETRIEKVEAKDKEITFTYQMIHFSREELDKDKFEMNMVPDVISNSCKTDGIRKMLDLGALMRLKYLDKDGLPFTQINVTKKDCE